MIGQILCLFVGDVRCSTGRDLTKQPESIFPWPLFCLCSPFKNIEEGLFRLQLFAFALCGWSIPFWILNVFEMQVAILNSSENALGVSESFLQMSLLAFEMTISATVQHFILCMGFISTLLETYRARLKPLQL